MLIDFTVENYKSIKEAVTLSTVAQNRKKSSITKESKRPNVKPDHQIAPTFPIINRDLELLPVIGIFGANASGKSNVINALDELLFFVYFGAHFKETNLRPFIPFRLSDTTTKSPTRFELRIGRENTIFTYTLALNQTRILQEKLEYIPATSQRMQSRLLFDRVWQEDGQIYNWKNGKDFGNAYREIQESLREYEPFMSFLTLRLNVEVVQPFVYWLSVRWPGVALGIEHTEHKLITRLITKFDPHFRDAVIHIVRRFDTGIAAIDIEKVETENSEGGEEFKVWVWHDADGKRVRWLMDEESTGTQRLFTLAFKMRGAFQSGGMILVDELGSNIHPNITRAIVRLFQNEKTNPNRAQLIFTSHDNTLQRGNLMRRDQIWFTQKREDGSTELYSLSDFRPRNDLAIDKAYLDGRFGAVPILPHEEELLEPVELAK